MNSNLIMPIKAIVKPIVSLKRTGQEPTKTKCGTINK